MRSEGKRAGGAFSITSYRTPSPKTERTCMLVNSLSSGGKNTETGVYTKHSPAKAAGKAALQHHDEAPRTSFPWHRLVEFWWASDCSTVRARILNTF